MTAHSSLYREFFTPDECTLLDAAPTDDLSSEINLLRVLVARLLAACRSAPQLALKQHAAVLSAFSAAGVVIAGLIRLQCQLDNPLDHLWVEIERGAELAHRRMHVYEYFKPPPRSSAASSPREQP